MNSFTTLLMIFFLGAVAPFQAQADEKEAHAGHPLKGYLDVAEALYKDDLTAAKKAAAEIVHRDENSALAKPASEVAKADDLASARIAFKKLSAEAVKIAGTHNDGEYTVMQCPMVKGGGGIWLSADGKVVNNPYFGSQMPHCGGPKE